MWPTSFAEKYSIKDYETRFCYFWTPNRIPLRKREVIMRYTKSDAHFEWFK